MIRFPKAATLAAAALCFAVTAMAQPRSLRDRYTKVEVRIPMRDGVRLFTTIYAPRDTTTRVPFLIARTPYSVAPYGADNWRAGLGPTDNPRYADAGFIFVYQDVRGRNFSEGEFTETTPHVGAPGRPKGVNESTDTYDTIAWLLAHQAGNNGRAALYGISYPGFYVAASCIDAHPALRACIPQAPIVDIAMGDDIFHNGAFLLAHNFEFYLAFGRTPRAPASGPDPKYPQPDFGSDAYDFFLKQGSLREMADRWLPRETAPRWQVLVDHPAYDAYWRARNLAPHLKRTAAAMLVVGGWYDAEDLAGTLGSFEAIERNHASAQATLVMGPWSHGGWRRGDGDALGGVHWSSKTAAFYTDSVEFPFIMHHLKDMAAPALPKALVFRTGADTWERLDAWPRTNTRRKSLFLQRDGGLSFGAPPAGRAFTSYVSDPARPVPSSDHIEGAGMPADYMTGDQRFAAQRPDVAVFQTAVLTEDVTISGAVSPVLHVATNGTDADFIVKLVDVFPGIDPVANGLPGDRASPGYQQLVRGEPFRARYRRSPEHPVPFIPLVPDSLRFTMPAINHTFRRGHRIMVQVQSSWFPHIDRNPQKFVTNLFAATSKDFQSATMRVFHDASRPSRLEVDVVP